MTARTPTRLAALLAATVVVLAGCGTADDSQASDPGTGTGSTGSSTPATPTDSGSPASPTPSETASSSGGTVAVPLYFVGDTPFGPKLFREFQQVSADHPVDEALALLSSGAALDPDYRTLLPAVAPTLAAGDTSQSIGLDLPSAVWADRPSGMSAGEAKLAVQQVVYTVQGVLQSRAPVQFLSGGPANVLGFDQSSFKAAGQNSVLALVNVTEPAEGATVSGTFTASGVANSFEATVPWEIQDQSGQKVLEGSAMADGSVDRLYPWTTQVDVSSLAPGTYTFIARTDDPSGGEGKGPTEDTKTITVG